MGSWTHKPEKRAMAKAVRQAFKHELPVCLVDDYSEAERAEDEWLDIVSQCTDENPCRFCLAKESWS